MLYWSGAAARPHVGCGPSAWGGAGDQWPTIFQMVMQWSTVMLYHCNRNARKPLQGGWGRAEQKSRGFFLGPIPNSSAGSFWDRRPPGVLGLQRTFHVATHQFPQGPLLYKQLLHDVQGGGKQKNKRTCPPPLYKRYGFIIMFGNYNLMLRLYQITVLF